MATLDAIIINWNTARQVAACLASFRNLRPEETAGCRIIVVDNASRDDSAAVLAVSGVVDAVIRNRTNVGFAAACNQGARGSTADYLLFLNPDTRLEPGSLSAPLAFLEREDNREIGICGVQLLDETGKISRSCARFPTPGRVLAQILGLGLIAPRLSPFMADWDHEDSRQVDQVMGAFFLVRRSLFEELGGFDERFFMYFEEMDFSYRARQHGQASYYLSDARIVHAGAGASRQVKSKRLYYYLRSRIAYGEKHFAPLSAALLLPATLLLEPPLRLLRSALRPAPAEAWAVIGAYCRLWAALPRLLFRGEPGGRP